MYFNDRRSKTLVSGLLFYLSLTLAQDTDPQTIYSLAIFSSQKPCAQSCFIYTFEDCFSDVLGVDIGCLNGGCTKQGALDNCYCRTDLQSAAQSYLTSCVENFCTAGDSSIDGSSAGSIYSYYCSSHGFPANVQATTTQEGTQAATTAASTNVPPSTSMNSGSTTTGDSFWTRAGGIVSIVAIIVASIIAIVGVIYAIKQYRITRDEYAARNVELNGWGGHTVARTH